MEIYPLLRKKKVSEEIPASLLFYGRRGGAGEREKKRIFDISSPILRSTPIEKVIMQPEGIPMRLSYKLLALTVPPER